MIWSFKNQGTKGLYNGVDTKAARKVCPANLVRVARRKLIVLEAARTLQDLKSPGSQLEKLEDDREGQHAIRMNQQ